MDDFSKFITEFKTLSAFKGIYKSLKYQQILKSLNNPMDISADECNNSTLSDNIRQYSSGELNSATVLDKWHQIAPERYWELCRTISNIAPQHRQHRRHSIFPPNKSPASGQSHDWQPGQQHSGKSKCLLSSLLAVTFNFELFATNISRTPGDNFPRQDNDLSST